MFDIFNPARTMNCVLKHKPWNNSSSFLQGCFLWYAEIYCFKPELSSECTSANLFLNCNFNFILFSFFVGISICYSIIYKSKFGMISEPDRPEGPLVIGNIDANSVHLSWKPPLEDNGGPILGYVIEAKDVLHMDVRKTYVWSDGPKTEHLVQDLDTGHIYQFRVYAQNEAGRSESLLNKSLVRIKAKSKKPPKPSKPSAEMLGENSVLLQWSVTEDTGNLNYLVERYEPKSDLWFSCNRQMVITTSYLVTGLSSDREYLFRVSSENVHGVSLPSETSDPIKWEVDEGEAPFIILPLKDCFIKSNESAFFMCEYTGTLPIQVNWTKDDIRIREGLGSVITSDDIGKSELTLHDVDSDDDDCSIQCSLQNAFGKKTSEAAIRILCMPQLLYPSSYKEDLTFDCGDALRLKVTFAGKPPPICKWFFNDKEPLLSDRISVTQLTNSLEIRIQDLTADDSGIYRIIVSNTMGEDSIDVRVIITGPPEAPNEQLKFAIVDDESFLTWDPPLNDGGSEIFNYVVEKKLFEEEIWSRCGITHKTSLNLGDSKDIEGYVFRVRATNIYGTSDPSKECRFQKACFDENIDESILQSLNNQDQEEKSTLIQFYDGVPTIIEIGNLKQEQFEQNEANRTELESVVVLESDGYHEDNLIDASKDFHIKDMNKTTSTLLKNFCNSYSEPFSEVSNFASEESFPICCPTFELQCEGFYRAQVLDIPLETVNYLPEVEYIPLNYFFSWIVHENVLEVYEPVCFLAISQQMDPLDISKVFLQNHYLGENEGGNTFMYFTAQNEDKHSNYFQKFSIPYKLHHSSNSIVIFHPPLMLEDVQLFAVQQHQDYQCNISVIPCISVQISVDNSLETLQNSGTCCLRGFLRAKIRYHSFEDFEDIISLCSTPVRTWKPALSVLPIKREATTTGLLKESFPGFTVTNPFDNPKAILKGLSSHKKSENEIHAKLENILPTEATGKLLSLEIPNSMKNELDTSNKLDTKFWNYADSGDMQYEPANKPPFLTSDDLLNLETIPRNIKEKKIQDISPQDSLESLQANKWILPDWLSHVSPNTETNLFEMSEKAENEIWAAEKKPITGDSIKLNLKEKSVEELLQLAEEVEKSFSQKAEQFESLESILQGELFSLEKDLEAVSDIHKFLDDPLGVLDSYTSDEHLNIGDPKGIETNLMEFTDVPCKPQGQLQTSGYPPEVVVHLQNRIVQSGCRTRLYCSIMGDPDPEITWKKNKKPVPRSSRYVFGNLVEFGVYLDIYNAKSTDNGEYTCIATNCYGSAQTQSYLQVIGNREVSPEEPKFLKSPDDISCKSGETVTMEWKMAGTPMPHVLWFKNAERIETNLKMDTFSNHRGCCHLTIRNVNANNSAIYTCYLENDTGSAISTVQLSVEDLKTSNLQEVFKNQPLIDDETITCKMILPPLPMEERIIDETSIRLKTNSYEKHFRRSENDQDPIGPVIAAHVLSSGQTWTILTWCPPLGGRCRYEYLIERRLLNSDHWTEVGRTYNTLFTVHALKKGRSYIFRVSAGNSRGWNLPVTMSEPVHAMPR